VWILPASNAAFPSLPAWPYVFIPFCMSHNARKWRLVLQVTLLLQHKVGGPGRHWRAFLSHWDSVLAELNPYLVGRYSSVGVTTCCEVEGPRIESRWRRDIPHQSRPSLGPNQLAIQWVLDLFPGGKAAESWR
jgi:hypothetical protein